MSRLKKFNIFIFLSSFTKAMVEVFIPLIIYENGYGVKEILMFFLIKFLFILLFIPLSGFLGNKINFKNLIIISNFLFVGMNIYFNYIDFEIYQLIIFAFLYGLYLIFYWIGRHIYGMSIIEEKKTTENVSSYTIFTLLGSLPAAYIGALILKNYSFTTLCIILFIISNISVIPLYLLKDKVKKEKIKLKKVIEEFPIKSYLFIFLEQIKHLSISLFPLYVYLEISKNYEFIGLSNGIICVASVLYIYFLAKRMDKNKKDYLSLLSILLAITWIFKLNIYTTYILVAMFFEGIFISSLETIILRNLYSYGKDYKILSYNLFLESIRNISRIIILVLYILFSIKLRTILYIGVLSLIVSSFIKLYDGKQGYSTYRNSNTNKPAIKQ